MKRIKAALGLLTVIAFAAFTSSCATTTGTAQIDESVAINAGFKTITPKTADQKALLAKLPVDQVTPITHQGKKYYVIPNVAKTQAYVGGPKQFQRYQDLQLDSEIESDNLVGLSLDDMDEDMDWDEWSGWGTWSSGAWY